MHDVVSQTPESRTDDGILCVESLNGLSQRQLHIDTLDYTMAGRPRTIKKDGVSYTIVNAGYNRVTFVCDDDAPADGSDVGTALSEEDKEFYEKQYEHLDNDVHIEKSDS